MTKKVWAIECDPEFYRYEDYYDEGMAEYDGIWAGGNRDFNESNARLKDEVVSALDDAYDDLYEADEPPAPAEVINRYFKKTSKESFTTLEIVELTNLVRMFNSCARSDENSYVASVLTILTGKIYEAGTINGNSQSDWLEIIYPEDRKAVIPYIQAVWFGTGTEFRITCDSYDEEPDFSEVDVYHDYTELWRPEDIKKWIAENNHVSPEDVVVKRISKTHYHKTFEYEEL